MYAPLNNLQIRQTISSDSQLALQLKAGVYRSNVYFILSHDDSMYILFYLEPSKRHVTERDIFVKYFNE